MQIFGLGLSANCKRLRSVAPWLTVVMIERRDSRECRCWMCGDLQVCQV